MWACIEGRRYCAQYLLENSAAALGNLARSHEMNALRIGICGGVEALVRMMDSAKTSVDCVCVLLWNSGMWWHVSRLFEYCFQR